MFELPIGRLLATYHRIVAMGQWMISLRQDNKQFSLLETEYQSFVGEVNEFAALCSDVSLSVTQRMANDICVLLRDAPLDNATQLRTLNLWLLQRFELAFSGLANCLKHEAATQVALSLPPDRVPLYSPATPLFGSEVSNAFPSMEYDIEEAGKCFALERSTACVFHLMRTMESAVGAVARCLGIPDQVKPAEKNWGAISRAIQSELKARNTATPPRWTRAGDKAFFDEIFVLMEAVRGVWRNQTMHPDKKYTPEEAHSVLGATKIFMAKISARLDEGGDPRA